MSFRDRVVVVTGVGHAGQVGEAVAQAFAEQGASLVLVDRQLENAAARASALREAGHRATAYGCDLTNAAEVSALASRVHEDHGPGVRALLNVAGGFALSGPVAESDIDTWQRQFGINLTTAYHTTRAFLPMVRAARGSIVYFASEVVLPSSRVAGVAAYAAAKAGVVMLMRAVAQEERANGVRANALAPGSIRTATNVKSMGDSDRLIERADVAAAALYLCSDAAHAISGQVIPLG
jgi:NAD(P)-dependent dehydrogenase (short-subunit alcohol dehydrogenase family)